jgi:hypothetical protein
MASTLAQLSKDLTRTAKAMSKVPADNARAMARITEAEIIRQQPRHFKQFDDRAIGIKGPRQRGARAWASVAGGGLVVIAEHGSYMASDGWTIYPKAYTTATKNSGVRYEGRLRIDETRRKVAEGQRVRGRLSMDVWRTQRMVLAFGAPSATMFRRSARHKPIPPGKFVARAAAIARERSGEIVADQVIKVMGTLR